MHMKTITNIIYPLFALFAFACFALAPQARAVCQDACLTNNNTVLGDDALVNNTGTDNMAIGFNALFSNTTGSWNTATGDFVLYSNTTGLHNTATGSGALESNREGGGNTANGFQALGSTTGSSNTGIGYQALAFNTRGTSPGRLNNDPKVQELTPLEAAPPLFEVPPAPHTPETT